MLLLTISEFRLIMLDRITYSVFSLEYAIFAIPRIDTKLYILSYILYWAITIGCIFSKLGGGIT